jgi:APA family basic amino acid/polyamine antiporter
VEWGDVVQRWTSLAKALGFVLLVAACVLFAHRSANVLSPAMPLGSAFFTGFVLAIQAAIYTYDGWTGPVYFSEEVSDPGRRIPRAMFGGVLSVAGVYVLVAVMLVDVLSISAIAGDHLALASAAKLVWKPHGDTVVRLVKLVSMIAAINAYSLMASRVLFAMSRDRLVPEWASSVNRGGSPVAALWVSAAASLVLVHSIVSLTFHNSYGLTISATRLSSP